MYCEVAVMGKIRDLFRICFRKQRYYEILNYKNTLSDVQCFKVNVVLLAVCSL